MKITEFFSEFKSTHSLHDSERNQLSFISAVNKTLRDINRRFKTTYAAVVPTDISDNTEQDWLAIYETSIHIGVKYYMQLDGANSGEPDPKAKDDYKFQLGQAMIDHVAAKSSFPTRTQAAS